MAVAAPNVPVTGSHAVENKNLIAPNVLRERDDSLTSTIRIPATITMTDKDATAVTNENDRSTEIFILDSGKGTLHLPIAVIPHRAHRGRHAPCSYNDSAIHPKMQSL